MLKLPPIKGTTRRRHKKPLLTHINSSIFKNGLTWFDIDSVTDPYNLTWHKYIPLYKQAEEYISSKKEFEDKRVLFPLKSEFDKGQKSSYAKEDLFPIKDNVAGRIKEMNNCEKRLKREWEKLESDELDFRASVESYNKFVATNKSKREASHLKIAYFKSRSQNLTKRITILKKYNSILREIIVEMKENYRRHRMYYVILKNIRNVFCTDVANLDKSYSPLAVIDRYLTIKEIEQSVSSNLFMRAQKYTSMSTELKSLEASREDLLHSLMMQFNDLKVRYEEASRKSLSSQQLYTAVREKCQNIIRCTYQTTQGISAIYKYIHTRKTDKRHIFDKKICDRVLYISGKINELEQIGISIRRIRDEKNLQKINIESSYSEFEVYFNESSPLFRKWPEDTSNVNVGTRAKKDELLHVKADILYKKENKIQETGEVKESRIQNIVTTKVNSNHNSTDSKRAKFSASLASFRSIPSEISVSSFKLPEIKRIEKKSTFEKNRHTGESKEQELSSYEKRKLFDRKRKLEEEKKRKSRVIRRRQEQEKSSKYHQVSEYVSEGSDIIIESKVSYTSQILDFDQSDNTDFGIGHRDLERSRRNTEYFH